jgi:hypothetical protein
MHKSWFYCVDSFIVAVIPNPPAGVESFDDDDDDDLKFKLPPSASRWKRKLYYFLRNKLKLPDIILMGLFSLSLKMWVIITLWFILAPIAHRWDLGPIFVSHLYLQCLDSWKCPTFLQCHWIWDILYREVVSLTSRFCLISFDGFLCYHGGFQILGTGFSIILLNLGKRQPGDVRYVHF